MVLIIPITLLLHTFPRRAHNPPKREPPIHISQNVLWYLKSRCECSQKKQEEAGVGLPHRYCVDPVDERERPTKHEDHWVPAGRHRSDTW